MRCIWNLEPPLVARVFLLWFSDAGDDLSWRALKGQV